MKGNPEGPVQCGDRRENHVELHDAIVGLQFITRQLNSLRDKISGEDIPKDPEPVGELKHIPSLNTVLLNSSGQLLEIRRECECIIDEIHGFLY